MLGRRFAKKGQGWTLMVYMVADDHDGIFTNKHINDELTAIRAAVGRHPNAQIAAQADIRGDGITRHFVENGKLVDQDMEQHAPGSVATIVDFIKFGMRKHPAEHYIVVFWGHGFGPAGLRYRRFVRPKELREALRAGFGRLGPPIEIVTFMSCQMSVVELAYEFSEWGGIPLTKTADHIIASQSSVEPLEPFPYDEVLSLLPRNGGDVGIIGRRLIEILNMQKSSGKGHRFAAPFALMNVRGARQVADAMKDLASGIVATNPFQPDHSKMKPLQKALHQAMGEALTHEDLSLLDLGRLGRHFSALTVDGLTEAEITLLEQIRRAGDVLSAAVHDAFVLQTLDGHPDTGASVFCPTHHDPKSKAAKEMGMKEVPAVEFAVATDMEAYRALGFAKHTKWSEVVDQARDA